ncbi:MAG: hypothetical protein IJQ69_07655 [Bacteroidales bacterium]|nr:hypothetical protein [Bacteroidales bacterium]
MKKIHVYVLVALCCVTAVLPLSCFREKEETIGILSASFIMRTGQSLECSVNQDMHIISNANDPVEPGMAPSMYVMKITYTSTIGSTVYYKGAVLESSVTEVDLSEPVMLTVVKEEKQVQYTLQLVEDSNDKSQNEGKRITADMRTSGFPDCAYFDIAYFKDKFFAITSSYPEGTAEENPAFYNVYKSEDGLNWTKVDTGIKVVGAYGARLLVFNEKLWAFGGGRFYGTDEDGNAPETMWGMFPDISQLFLCSTSDGETWTKDTPVDASGALGAYVDSRLFIQGNKLTLYGGLGCVFGQIQKSFSLANTTDGITWNAFEGVDKESMPAKMSCYALYNFKGKLYVAGGFQNYIDADPKNSGWYHGEVYGSVDGGLTWNEEVADAGFGKMWNMRVAGTTDVLYMVGGEYFAEGEEGRTLKASNKVFRSTDGVHWASLEGEVAMPEFFKGRTRPCLVPVGDMLWIFGGRGITNGYYGGIDIKDEIIFDTWKKKIK